MNISVCIATYGDDRWRDLAMSRAVPSVLDQECEIIDFHDPDGTVSSSRNNAAALAHSDWLCFLDADDELDRHFIRFMKWAIQADGERSRVLYTPSVSYVRGRHRQKAKFWPECEPHSGNWLVIGTLIHRDLFFDVGGFRDYGEPLGSNAYEDWALWARCQIAGAQIVKVPRAVYIAHQEATSRHRNVPHSTKVGWHHEIGRDLWPERYPA